MRRSWVGSGKGGWVILRRRRGVDDDDGDEVEEEEEVEEGGGDGDGRRPNDATHLGAVSSSGIKDLTVT